MMSDIYEKAGIAKQCTNHSLRATAVHILDEAEFAGRHMYRYIMSTFSLFSVVEPLEVGRRLLLIVLDISLSALSDVQLV
jgi:hypothetical protein